jgi:DNA polymerase III, delta subunit
VSGAPPFLPDVLGHEDLKARLHAFFAGERLGQGILLVGEEGRGKRTLAHALARAVLERAAPPDARERARRAIDSGTHAGLIHVEPLRDERFIPVRRVRRLLEQCALKVSFGDARVVVLSRLHAVNEESGNALLKFLEEPPDGTLVLATARDQASVLETIRSRFHVLPAGPLPAPMVERLLEAGGFSQEDRALLVPLVRGAPGRAWDLARGNLTKSLIEPVRAFFDPGVPLHLAVEGLVKTARDEGSKAAEAREAVGPRAAVQALAQLRGGPGGDEEGGGERRGEGTLEAARVWLRPVVEAVASTVQDLLRRNAGLATSDSPLLARVAPPDCALRRATAPRLVQALEAAIACLENLDHNLTLNLALEALALRLRAA